MTKLTSPFINEYISILQSKFFFRENGLDKVEIVFFVFFFFYYIPTVKKDIELNTKNIYNIYIFF